MSQLLDSLLYRLPLPHQPGLVQAAEYARAEAGIEEVEIDEDQVFAVSAFDEEAGRAERARNGGDNAASRDILISAARALLESLGADK